MKTLSTLLVLTSALLAGSVQAKNILQKHPTASGVAAGVAAHHAAKNSAAHGSHGLMARHPVATGVVAGAAAHHMLKKH